MDTLGNYEHHSILKLNILQSYLPSLINVIQTFAKEVEVIDAFCGKGGNEYTDGSAKIILKHIAKKAKDFPNTKFSVRFNDLKKENTDIVKEIFEREFKNSPVSFFSSNLDGELFLANHKNSKQKFTFLFYDPFTYSLIKKSLIHDFMAKNYAEALIFIPFSHAYRFAKGELDDDHLLLKFLEDALGENYKAKCNSEPEFLKALENQFRPKDGRCNSLLIQQGPNKYALLFISKKIRGSELFLDSCYRSLSGQLKLVPSYEIKHGIFKLIIKGDGDLALGQMSLLSDLDVDDSFRVESPEIFKSLQGQTLSNKELHNYIVECNLLSSHVSKLIKSMIDSNNLIMSGEDKMRIDKPKGLYLQSNPKQVVYYTFI